MQDKLIRLGVDDTGLRKTGVTAKGIVDEMIRSSRQYSTSSKEVLKDIEEQIRLIEKRNKLTISSKREEIEAEKRLISIENQRKTSIAKKIGSSSVRQETLRDISSEYASSRGQVSSKENVLKTEQSFREKQISELRNIVDEIKNTSRNEIREDRTNVERQLKNDDTLNKLGIDKNKDAQQELKKTIQRGEIGDVGESEAGERSRLNRFGSAFNKGAELATSKNELYALAGVVGMIPVVGQGLSSLAQRLFSSGETAERSMTKYSYSSFGNYGKSSEEWLNAKSLGLTSIGLDPSEVLGRKADITRTTGRGISGRNLSQLMGAEQFVGSGAIDQISQINRYGGGNMASVLQVLEGNQRSVTRLTENISAYVSASNRSLQIGSNIDEKQLAKTVMGISAATGQQGIGQQQTVSAIQGLGQTGNPLVRSLMMRAFRQSNPNASMWDIQTMMEDPLANFKQGGGKFFENIKGMSGGGDMYKQVLYSIFGGNLSRKRIDEIVKSGDFTEIESEINKAKGGADFLKESKKGAGIATEMTALTDATFQEYGQKSLEIGGDTVKEIKAFYEKWIESDAQRKKDEKSTWDKVLTSIDELSESMNSKAILDMILGTNGTLNKIEQNTNPNR